ncbi:hypothetical protein LSH36_12g03099 [Paralvinella palmiformis]|uniref:RWD domain-containing protein n=1 Tax=Paralvinella palmiformis TaxID=53620 RepID=A0AAD9KC97_9ANNE|nr:hypothetical protein LSH36_12g03099 [Paralvinella palmiformis]
MSTKELQQEEHEVLQSIYESDVAFKEINETKFQYKVGEDGSNKSFLIEVIWGENYPNEMPDVNLSAFYNNHISESNKTIVINKLREEIEPFIGSAMTYTLFEYARENFDELMTYQTESSFQLSEEKDLEVNRTEVNSKKKEKKEHLTKAQKRKLYNRFGNQQTEKPRGWDWVDVIKHLSQTGLQPKSENS